MTYTNDEGYPELRQARADRDRLVAHIEGLPAHLLWNAREFWDWRLAEADAEVDRQIEMKNLPKISVVVHESENTALLLSCHNFSGVSGEKT